MVIRIPLKRDSDNSYTEGKYLEISKTDNLVHLELKGQDREVSIAYSDFCAAMEAIQKRDLYRDFEQTGVQMQEERK